MWTLSADRATLSAGRSGVCTYFENELWFKLEKSMWMKHSSTFQDHAKYIHNDIVKTFIVSIIR